MDDNRGATLSAHLEYLRRKYESGDKSALLDAVDYCAMYKLVMPEWVTYEFVTSYRKWTHLEVKTLDEAFEVERTKSFRIDKEREWVNNSANVYMAILEAERQGLPISNESKKKDSAIYVVSKKFGFNRQKIWDMYNDFRRNTAIGRGFEKGRKLSRKHKNKSE